MQRGLTYVRPISWASFLALALGQFMALASIAHVYAAEETTIADATTDDAGCLVHKVNSPWQGGETDVRVLLPEDIRAEERLPVVFVLPVEAGRESRYGDGLLEIQRAKLQNRYRAIFVAPSFFRLPWYVDHASNPHLQQETYFVRHIVPFVFQNYPVAKDRAGHLLLGFSKSGWGAVSLLLRHPNLFERAAAWDAPLMMHELGKYGTTPIFGAEKVLDAHELPTAIEGLVAPNLFSHRLILTGYGGFRAEHRQFHALLEARGIQHLYRDGPQRKHDWHSGWVAEAVELLFAKPMK
jgi:S-formylglutathione hydrolase FrmB